MHTILVWKYFPAACKLDKAELWMPHYYNWGALACSAVSRLLLCCFPLLPSLLHLSRYILRFHLLVLWSFKALLVIFTGTLRICDCETVWVFMTFMAFNSRGEMNCWIPPPSCLFVFFLFLSVFLPLSPPPPLESACSIPSYVTFSLSVKISRWVILFVWLVWLCGCVCFCLCMKKESGWGRAKEQGIIYDRCTL